MSNSKQDWKEELQHFEYCKAIIAQNQKRYQAEYDVRHAQVQQLHQAINGGDVELYNQLMTAVSLEEQAANALRKNIVSYDKPYFGRIDYLDKKLNRREQIYIGKNGVFKDKINVLIADWRAPVASVYYENELGDGEYGLPDETQIPIRLDLKRTYDVANSTLNGYYDSDVVSNDELLVKYLSKNKDVVLGEIIATIQKEQNAIIRESPFANLIVQGVAGSGKTTVAMHRISYLLYNYKERFESNEFCIIGGNDLLLNYITSGLPELDVPNIKHLRMDQLLIRLCEKDWKKKFTYISPDATAGYRCTMDFIRELEWFLMKKIETIVDCRPLIDPQIGTILSESSNLTLLREHRDYSIVKYLTTMDERIKTRIQFLLSGYDRDTIAKMLRKYAGHYKNKYPKPDIFLIYQEFLSSYKPAPRTAQEAETLAAKISAHRSACAAGAYDIYDIAALALIHYRVSQKAPNEEFGLLFIDEAQDFGISIYYVLKTLLPHTYFTIMGDVSQNINYETGINDWYELNRFFLTDPKDKFLLLQKSYRNTIEISQYAGNILEAASFGRYKITPVIRHGLPVTEEEFWSDMEMADRIAYLVPEIRQRGYTTTAIICMSENVAKQARELLKNTLELVCEEDDNYSSGTMILPISLVKGLEFDAVILWNPRIRQNMAYPDKAKLLYVAATRALHELYVFSC